MQNIAEIEWHTFPTSDKTLTVEQAHQAAAEQRNIYGYCISGSGLDGRQKLLVDGKWHYIDPCAT